MLAASLAISSACFAAGPTAHAPRPGPAAPGPAAAPGPQGASRVCVDVQTGDRLTQKFAGRLRKAIAASGALELAVATDSCALQLHVPGNLLRFDSAGGLMVSTVVVVTSPSGHYLSTSVSACRASDLEPCAVRAVAAAKLALLVRAEEGR